MMDQTRLIMYIVVAITAVITGFYASRKANIHRIARIYPPYVKPIIAIQALPPRDYKKVLAAYQKKKFNIVQINVNKVKCYSDVTAVLVRDIHFPAEWSEGLDSFIDELRGLDWLENKNTAVLFKDISLLHDVPGGFDVIKLLWEAKLHWAQWGVDFLIFNFEENPRAIPNQEVKYALSNDELKVLFTIGQEHLITKQKEIKAFPQLTDRIIDFAIYPLQSLNYIQKTEGLDQWELTERGTRFIENHPKLFKEILKEYRRNIDKNADKK